MAEKVLLLRLSWTSFLLTVLSLMGPVCAILLDEEPYFGNWKESKNGVDCNKIGGAVCERQNKQGLTLNIPKAGITFLKPGRGRAELI